MINILVANTLWYLRECIFSVSFSCSSMSTPHVMEVWITGQILMMMVREAAKKNILFKQQCHKVGVKTMPLRRKEIIINFVFLL